MVDIMDKLKITSIIIVIQHLLPTAYKIKENKEMTIFHSFVIFCLVFFHLVTKTYKMGNRTIETKTFKLDY